MEQTGPVDVALFDLQRQKRPHISGRSQGAVYFLATDETGRVKGGERVVSAWWLVFAFLGGGFAGMLLMALMRMAGGLPEQQTRVADLTHVP